MVEINRLGDFGTSVEEIRVDLDEPNTTAAKDRIRLFICRCCERHRAERFRWMRHDWRLALVPGKDVYDLREDFDVPLRTIEGDLCHILQDGSSDVVYDLKRSHPGIVKARRAREYVDRGNPTLFAVESGQLRLDPTPTATTSDILIGRGFKIVPGPERSQVSGTWSFSPDSFTNEWFTAGSELVNCYVRYKMLAGPLRNHEDAGVAAGEYEEIKRVMLMETEEEEMPLETVPYWPSM